MEHTTVYGTPTDDPVTTFAPAIVAFFAYFFVYILTGVSFLRERTGGTLERLMATPVTRGEVVLGYTLGFGLFATIQVAVLMLWALGSLHVGALGPLPAFSIGLGIAANGSPILAFLVVVLLAVGAVSLGIFLSTFARTELQIIQFIPIVLAPQFLLSGVLFPVSSLPSILQPLVAIMPLNYAVDGLRQVFIRGADLGVPALQLDLARPRDRRGLLRDDRGVHDPPRRRVTGAARPRGRTGRRPGASDTRARVLQAARTSFGERGFDGATIRDIALRAGVDPALVHHYFGSKQQLFVAAMELPFDLALMVSRLLDGPGDELGERFVRLILELWEAPANRSLLLGVVRSASTDPVAAAMLRRLLAEGPFLALARAIDRPDATFRATLAGSQLIGLAMARYVVAVEPLASMSTEVLVRAMGPTMQRYLVGDLKDLESSTGPVDASRPPA